MAADNKYNVEAAEISANEVLHLPITEAAPVYEQLLATFPTAAKFWKQYVEAQMAVNNDDATKQIFSRCLMNCLQVQLWQCYIRFIKKANEKKGAEGFEETRKAFDFTINHVGSDIASGPIWTEYINFLKSVPVQTSQEDMHRVASVRKAYQRAIVTPCHHVEQLWKDYESFENSASRQLAKGVLSELQPKFHSAKAVYRERKKYIDEIEWNMLAIPPTGSYKEEQQWVAWKRFLSFEKSNPQRIDSTSSNKRIVFTYEQCLMYLYHYPDVWYDYATWHVKSGSTDSAIRVYQRALKALPDSEMLKYAYAELEESRGAIQASKKIYESMLGDDKNATALAQIQFIRFLRRTEGVEAARKFFLDVHNSPDCTYQVYAAYAMMAFCLDKNPKAAHGIFEAGLKRFMNEPDYILEYADFLQCMNDDRNIRALFERALSSLPPENSVEVWKRFVRFEQTYGELASLLKVEQRRKEALSGGDEGAFVLDASLQDVVSRYSFMNLLPCSSTDLDHLARHEWLAKNMNRKQEKIVNNAAGLLDKGSPGFSASVNVVNPDVSQMVVYDPGQKPAASGTIPGYGAAVSGSNGVEGILKGAPPALVAFIANLPAVEGPAPDVDFVLSICLQSNIPLTTQPAKFNHQSGRASSGGGIGNTNEHSGSTRGRPTQSASSGRTTLDRHSVKRKDPHGRQDEDEPSVHSLPLPKDAFRLRQMQRVTGTVTASQTGSTSYGSALSGEHSGSTLRSQ